MGMFKWLKDKTVGEVLEDYGTISRTTSNPTEHALSAKLTRTNRLFLLLSYGWTGHTDAWRVDVSDDLPAHLRRIADDIERHRDAHAG